MNPSPIARKNTTKDEGLSFFITSAELKEIFDPINKHYSIQIYAPDYDFFISRLVNGEAEERETYQQFLEEGWNLVGYTETTFADLWARAGSQGGLDASVRFLYGVQDQWMSAQMRPLHDNPRFPRGEYLPRPIDLSEPIRGLIGPLYLLFVDPAMMENMYEDGLADPPGCSKANPNPERKDSANPASGAGTMDGVNEDDMNDSPGGSETHEIGLSEPLPVGTGVGAMMNGTDDAHVRPQGTSTAPPPVQSRNNHSLDEANGTNFPMV